MTRRSVYGVAMAGFLVAMALTIASIIVPRWITRDITVTDGNPVHVSYGLHRYCSSLSSPSCIPFPTESLCRDGERYFCNMWRSVGFLSSFAVVLEGMTAIAFLVLLLGGKQRRESGVWILCTFLGLVVVVQVVGMALVAYLFEHDPRFSIPGFMLGESFSMCVGSWVILGASAVGVGVSRVVLEPEGGYELIPDGEMAT